jgi:hypothetical protein
MAAGQGEAAARNLPTTICRRLAGVNRSPSRVARSRSPLRLSAPMMRPTNTLATMAALSVSYTISCGGIRLKTLSLAITYE